MLGFYFRVLIILINSFVFLYCSSGDWYHDLPKEDDGRQMSGVWKKNTNPRSPINSSWYFYTWSEEIRFNDASRTFERIYTANEKIANKEKILVIKGTGFYLTHKNWLLLKIETLDTRKRENGKIVEESKKSINSSLLYYTYAPGNLLIPMIHDRGFEEKNFGVKDGASEPYLENENFFTYIKIYAFKDYQSHAYFLKAEK